MRLSAITIGAAAALALATFAHAGPDRGGMVLAQGAGHEAGHGAHHGHGPSAPAGADHGAHGGAGQEGDRSPSSAAFREVNDKMHRDMAIAFTGEADVDFVRGMIPHHQGAIDMARVVLEFGDDPEIRALAEGIIAAQEKEIAEMKAWLAAKGK